MLPAKVSSPGGFFVYGAGIRFARIGVMFPKHRSATRFLPLIAALSFLAHVHYTKMMHSMRFERHGVVASMHGR